jgi:hypothetical protein
MHGEHTSLPVAAYARRPGFTALQVAQAEAVQRAAPGLNGESGGWGMCGRR